MTDKIHLAEIVLHSSESPNGFVGFACVQFLCGEVDLLHWTLIKDKPAHSRGVFYSNCDHLYTFYPKNMTCEKCSQEIEVRKFLKIFEHDKEYTDSFDEPDREMFEFEPNLADAAAEINCRWENNKDWRLK